MKGHHKSKGWWRTVDRICAECRETGDLPRWLSNAPSSSGLTRGPIPRCSRPPPYIRMSNILHAVLADVGVTEWVLGSSPRMTTLLDGSANLQHHDPHPVSLPLEGVRSGRHSRPIDTDVSIGARNARSDSAEPVDEGWGSSRRRGARTVQTPSSHPLAIPAASSMLSLAWRERKRSRWWRGLSQ